MSDPGGSADIVSEDWDFTYNGTFTADASAHDTLTPTHVFAAAGSGVVALQATDASGASSLSTLNVTVQGVPPTVSLQGPTMVTAGQAVNYTGSASESPGVNDPLTYAYDFNYNGTTFTPDSSGSTTAQTVFATSGNYVVAFQATNAEGQSSLATETVTVNPSSSLVVNAGPDQWINEGNTASFSGSWTDGFGTVASSTAQWDFNYNGSSFVADPSANGTLTPTHQFTTPGTYLVALELTDSYNFTSLGELYVTVANVAPTVNAGPDQTVNVGATTQFSGTATDPGGPTDIVSEDWDFGYNGTFVADASAHNTLTPTHVFTGAGTYTVALQATDASGASSLSTLTVTAQGVDLNSLVVPAAALEGDTVSFSAEASTTLSGANLTYNWAFGDGGTASGVDLTDPTHVYAAPAVAGTPYTVTLSVSDGTTSTSGSGAITVTNAAPRVNAGPSQTIYAGAAAQFNATITDPGGPSDITSIQWDFNNNGSTFNADPSANGLTDPTFTYTSAGTYVVAVEATDQSGATTEDFTTLTVKPSDALLVNAGPDLTVTAGQPLTLQGSYTDPGGTVSSSGIAWDTQYDGNTFTANVTGTLTPSVTYTTAGTYYAALEITDSTGAMDMAVTQITVNPVSYVGPTANAGSNQTINAGGTASFSGSYTDPDGTVASSGIAWDPDYDGVTFNPVMTGTLTPTYQYGTPGTYTVALQITDSNGLTSLSTLTTTVNSVAPTVTVQGPSVVTAGQAVTYTGTASLPPGDQDTLSTAWDFNYDGSNFIASSATGLTPQTVFATPGTYVVAFQASDAEGDTSLATESVTVNASSSLVVNAGPDQALTEGDTTTFAGSWTDGSGTVNISTAQWDFNYDGKTFVANASANGTLTPSYQFTTPGTYLVALQLTDSKNVTSLGELYVDVSNVAPTVDAGLDQTVSTYTTTLFNGTVTDPGGSGDIVSEDWDFDYDGNTFVADPSAHNTLTPSYVFTTAGTYEVALQVTDASGATSLSTLAVTVNAAGPTATVSNSSPAVEGSPVTFTVSNVADPDPGDTPSYAVDWIGSGTFQPLSSSDLTTNPDSSVSFTHVYDVAGSYAAVVELVDGNGDATNYTQNVTITPAPISASFGPSGGSTAVTSTTPFLFTNVSDASVTETQLGFTYYVSVNGGAYTSSSSASSLPLSGLALGTYTVSGYVENAEGVTSSVYSSTVNLQNPDVIVINNGTGTIQLNWTGGSSGNVLPNNYYTIAGPANGLTVTLTTNQANYDIATNGTLATVNAAAGVQGVNLTVDTLDPIAGWQSVGDGSIGEIDPPAGSTLTVLDRGDLGSIVGPTGLGSHTGITAQDLAFVNLTGKITNVDVIDQLAASGWLGTQASQLVAINGGIGSLAAYGVGATVESDLRQYAGDPVMAVTVGDGGVPGAIDAGNVGNVQIGGDVNVFQGLTLSGNFDPPSIRLLNLRWTRGAPKIELGEANLVVLSALGPNTVDSIKTRDLDRLIVLGSLRVNKSIDSDAIGTVFVSGDLTIGATGRGSLDAVSIGFFMVSGNLIVADRFESIGLIRDIYVGEQLVADIRSRLGDILAITVGNDAPMVGEGSFLGSVQAKLDIRLIWVRDNFTLQPSPDTSYLVRAGGAVGQIASIDGDIGVPSLRAPGEVEKIEGQSIATIDARGLPGEGGNLFVDQIIATNGDITGVRARKTITSSITAIGGDILWVLGGTITGNIRAKMSFPPGNPSGKGGNIWYVFTTNPLNDTIWADDAIGSVNLGANSTATIKAQQGGIYDPTTGLVTEAALLIAVSGAPGPFLGTVQFQFPPTVSSPALFTSGAPLLKLVDSVTGLGGKLWSVEGSGEDTNVTATFIWNPKVLTANPLLPPLPPGLQPDPEFTLDGKPQTGWSIK